MPQTELRRTIRLSIIEGLFYQVYASLAAPGSTFLTKFAVLLQATPLHFGILSAIGQLAQVFQVLGIAISRRLTSRKRATVWTGALARALALGYGFLFFLLPAPAAIWVFLVLLALSASLQAVSGNLWVAWIADMIPLSIRGRFFARRSQYLMVAGLVCGYLFGALVDLFDPQPGAIARSLRAVLPPWPFLSGANLPYVLLVVFGAGAVIGVLGLPILARQPERPKAVEQEKLGKLLLEPLRDGNFRRLLLYAFWWMMAVGVGAPFWGPFMIKNLGMPLVYIMLYGTLSTLASLLALGPWGRLIDRFGNKPAMRLALVLGGLNPILWVFATPQHYEIIYLEAVSSGVMWAGANLVAVNLVLAIAPEDKRQSYSGLFNAFSGLVIVLPMLLSGLLLPSPLQIGSLYLQPEQVLFGLGGLLRWSAQIPLTWVYEPRARPMREVWRHLFRR
ncbi:MAG: MFS transporter [Chloroflexia bacterium]